MPSPERALSALGLLLTCMYAGKEIFVLIITIIYNFCFKLFYHLSGKVENEINPSEELDAMANVHTIERVTILFDRLNTISAS